MTSASSSSPKKGLSFFSYHRNLFGRRLWVGVVSIVLQLLFYTVATPLRIVYDRSQVADQLTTEIARATYRTKQAQMIFGQMCLSSVAMGLTLLLAVVIAHQGFAYVFSRRELDFYMSQPVKRSRHFRDVYINGIMLFALPYMISVFLGVCVAEGMHSMSTLVFGEILYGMLRMFFFFVAVYSIAVIAVLTTGREIYAILVTIFLLLFEFVAHAVLALLRSYYLVTYYPTVHNLRTTGIKENRSIQSDLDILTVKINIHNILKIQFINLLLNLLSHLFRLGKGLLLIFFRKFFFAQLSGTVGILIFV